MNNKYIVSLFLLFVCFMASCNNDNEVTRTPVYMTISLKDTSNVAYAGVPANDYDFPGDSIVLSYNANKLVFNIETNATWTCVKAKAWGNSGRNAWFHNPTPTFGGGNSRFAVDIDANVYDKYNNPRPASRRVYLYVATGDSSVVKKFVFLQEAKAK